MENNTPNIENEIRRVDEKIDYLKSVCGQSKIKYEDIGVEEVEITEPQFSTDKEKEQLYLYSLRHLAYANSTKGDNLTNMLGLSSFFFQMNEIIRENPDEKYGMIVMDITQFKAVNEFCGRDVGDEMLVYIADYLRDVEYLRPYTLACHIRADNFCLCTAFKEQSELVSICVELIDKLRVFPVPYKVHPSFGICAGDEYMPEVSSLKDRANIALSNIKGKFYADYMFFDYSMKDRIMHDRMVENEIIGAMKNGDIVPFIQPKVDMVTGRIVGGEALVRWISKEKGVIPPGSFLPPLEENGFIINIDKLIWKEIFKYQRSRLDRGLALVPISVNLSRVHVYDDDVVETFASLREEYGIPPKYIVIELTESAMINNTDSIFEKVRQLQREGFLLSMDDFGTGYSSLFMLKRQPVDEVKMDREFILDLDIEESVVILQNVATMLQELGKNVIVEGIETAEQKQKLLDIGLIHGQGYYFYKPMPVDEFDDILNSQ